MDHPKAVAEAAVALLRAILAARMGGGYRVVFPDHVLTGIPVSETRRVPAPDVPAVDDAPVPVIGRASKKDA